MPPRGLFGDLKTGLLVMAFAAPVEYWRGQGGFGWDKGTLDRNYPGFDPAKLTKDYTKAAEIKNGRLAMLAIAGFFVQHQVVGGSPLGNVLAHIADPLNVNALHNVALFATAGDPPAPYDLLGNVFSDHECSRDHDQDDHFLDQ